MNARASSDPSRLILDRLTRLGRRRRRVLVILAAIGCWLPAATLSALLADTALAPSLSAAGLLAGVAAWLAWRFLRTHPVDLPAIAASVDRHMPDVEHSAELLMAAPGDLGPVARLQRARAARALAEKVALARSVAQPAWRTGLTFLAGGAALAALMTWWVPMMSMATVANRAAASERGTLAMPAVPAIDQLILRIEPPAYTQRPGRSSAEAEITVAEGARVTWQLTVSGPPATAELVIDDHVVTLEPSAEGRFAFSRTVDENHVFRLRLRSDTGEEVATTPYGRILVLADQPPRVTIEEPPVLAQVGAASLGLTIRATAADDYGISRTALVATLALGAGEMVQFREQRFPLTLAESLADGTQVLIRRLDLEALGLEPGGELYLFVEAWDNRPDAAQRSRSATHVVRWPGATATTADLGAGLPMILPPEAFRSQRQIIIDTERLVAVRRQLDEQTFALRARRIAQDQHALRLRYGAILGDEFVDGRPVGVDEQEDGKAHHDDAPGSPHGDHPDDHGHAAENGGLSFGDDDPVTTTRLIDLAGELEGDLVHAHDSEESATFFTTETKRVLKSSLANMWEAELRLHLADPGGALPYEYRALRLLKEVQQASRVYVRRVGFETLPLDPARRLTGDLDGVVSKRPRHSTKVELDLPAVRAVLAALTAGGGGSPSELAERFEAAIGELARQKDMLDIEALERLRAAAAVLRAGDLIDPEVRRGIESALWKKLPEPTRLPDRGPRPGNGLAAAYRAALSSDRTPE